MSDYAIVLSCSIGYSFGMISSMNAQNYFGTDADWEIAYPDTGWTPERREAISNAFPFNVTWTPVNELMETVVDRRTNPAQGLERMFLGYWLLAYKLLKEKKYKAVCVIQADTFIFSNLDLYFKIAESGFLVCSGRAMNCVNADDLPFGDDKALWDRSQCGVFDSVNFISQEYTNVPETTIEFQCEDSFKGEANHPVIALNRAVCKHGKKDRVLGLDSRLWAGDSIWSNTKLHIVNKDRVYNDRSIQLKAWHCRWWQTNRALAEWRAAKKSILEGKNKEEILRVMALKEYNYNLVKNFMERFNNMIPEIKSEEYLKGPIRRPRYELGEDG